MNFHHLDMSMGGELPQTNVPKLKEFDAFFFFLIYPIWAKLLLLLFFTQKWYGEDHKIAFLGVRESRNRKFCWHKHAQLETTNPLSR